MANPFPFVAGSVLTAAELNGIGEWLSYTPVLTATTTDPTLGTGSSSVGGYSRIQNLIVYRFSIAFGSSGVNAGSGSYEVSLPVNAVVVGNFYTWSAGQTSFYDQSANKPYFGPAWIQASTKLRITYQTGWNDQMSTVGGATPVVPAANDVLSGLVIYQAA